MKALLGGAGFAALLLVVSLPATAQPWGGGGDCRDRIEHAEARLDFAIDRYGRYSDAARDARHHLEDVRDWCRGRHDHGWFDMHVYHEHGDPFWNDHPHHW
jgi:hypothetical protein